MSLIAKIKAPVLEEMRLFDQKFANALQSRNPLLSNIHEYVLQGSGKQIRPILVLLTAKLCGEINESTLECAVSLELLHTASLIHDDVVDDTMERRSRPSINAKWNNKIAILSGDYMLSNSLYHATLTENLRILDLISNIGMQLADGELLQLANSDSVHSTEEEYFQVIRKKTALLFSTCTEMGAISVSATEKESVHLRKFGEYLGICFQLKDDIFDYFDNSEIGKPTGNDLRDGKVTLPLIYALKNTSSEEKKEIQELISSKNFSPDNIERIMTFAKQNGGIEYAEKQMEEFKNKAIQELSIFPDNTVKETLIECADFVVNRKA